MANKAKIVTVEFKKPFFVGKVGYRPGDIAGFTEDVAEILTKGRTVKEANREIKEGPWAVLLSKAKNADEVVSTRNKNSKADDTETK